MIIRQYIPIRESRIKGVKFHCATYMFISASYFFVVGIARILGFMKIFNCVIPALVYGSLNTRIVPVFVTNDRFLEVHTRVSTIGSSRRPVNVLHDGRMILLFQTRTSMLYCPNNPTTPIADLQVSFIGANGQTIQNMTLEFHIWNTRINDSSFEGSQLNVGPYASIYTTFPHGFILYPGQLTTVNSEYSMILNSDNPVDDGYCGEGSLFYVPYLPEWGSDLPDTMQLMVDTKIILNGVVMGPQPIVSTLPRYGFNGNHWEIYHLGTKWPSEGDDTIPSEVGEILLDVLGGSVLDNCDLVNGNYPSIHFRFMELRDNVYFHVGTIVYGPEDYLEPIGGGRCRVILEWSSDNVYPTFGHNFLKKIAINFKSDQVGFCDPAL